jgi:hypothetical protein
MRRRRTLSTPARFKEVIERDTVSRDVPTMSASSSCVSGRIELGKLTTSHADALSELGDQKYQSRIGVAVRHVLQRILGVA